MLPADPRRWYLELRPGPSGGNLIQMFPGTISGSFPTSGFTTYSVVWKFLDCPAMVTGPWFMQTGAAAAAILIEQLYVGG